jgi:hypothetical protein
MIIHAKAENKGKSNKMSGQEYKWYKEVSIPDMLNEKRTIGAAYLEGLGQDIKEQIQDPAQAYRHNPLGFSVAATPNGSMTRECMLDWTVHFIKHLSDGSDGPKQGKGGEPVFLHLDGHISRWNMHALALMLEHNVLPLFSPSHTSMWGQANDNGTNLSLQNLLERIAATMRMHRTTAPVSYHNLLIYMTYKEFVIQEHNTLKATGTNVAKHSYFITGLTPFNPRCTNWTGAIETLGQKTLVENKGCEKLTGWEIRVRDAEDDEFWELTAVQATQMMEGYEGFYNDHRDLAVIATLRAKAILARWREAEMERLRQKELYFEQQHQQQQQQRAAAATTTEQQQDQAAPPPAAAAATTTAEQDDLPALEAQLDDHESDPKEHAEGEVEQLVLMLVHFVDARTIVQEMAEHGHDVGTPQQTPDEITHTILTTTKLNKHVTLTYYENGIEDEDRYVEGTAVKVAGAEWLTCISGLPRGTISSTANLMDSTKWMVHRPVEFFTSREHASQMARIKRLDRCERGRMNEVAKRKCWSDREVRKREEYERMKERVQGGRYEFDDFNNLWILAESPFERSYQVYNNRTKETQEVHAVIKGNEETATSTLVLNSLAEVLNSKSKKRQALNEGGQRKKQKLGVVSTMLGEDVFSALAKLRQDGKTLRANDGDAARKKLTDGYHELKKNYDAFQQYAKEKRGAGHEDLSVVSSAIDKSKGMDHYLRVFFPKCGLLSKNNNAKEDFINSGHLDGRHNFKLTPISVMFRLEQIASELAKALAEITDGLTHEVEQANDNEGGEQPDVEVQDDDESVLSFDLHLEEADVDANGLSDLDSVGL